MIRSGCQSFINWSIWTHISSELAQRNVVKAWANPVVKLAQATPMRRSPVVERDNRTF